MPQALMVDTETAPTYEPANHYWRVPGAGVWSSAERGYVSEESPTFLHWLSSGNRLLTEVESESDVRSALAAAGFADRAPGYVPPVVSLWQAREALRMGGHFDKVNAAIQAFGGAPLAAWEYGSEVRRNAPLIEQMALILKLSDAQVDALFVVAASLEI